MYTNQYRNTYFKKSEKNKSYTNALIQLLTYLTCVSTAKGS